MLTPRIAILIPCFNEASSIASVIKGFISAVPHAQIYVYNNNSTDKTDEIAKAAGAVVRHESRQGKGFVVCRMFADIEADVYVLVDGDGTYDSSAASLAISLLSSQQLDFVNLARDSTARESYRAFHQFGNKLFSGIVAMLFSDQIRDMLSGYKVFSRRFVKTFPRTSRGFEIETQLVIHALQMDMPIGEINSKYGSRPTGSPSKLNTLRDGMRILLTIGRLVVSERPRLVFGLASLTLGSLCVALGWPVLAEFLESGLVSKLPTWVTVIGLGIASVLSLFAGLLLHAVSTSRRETRRLHYLSIPLWQ